MELSESPFYDPYTGTEIVEFGLSEGASAPVRATDGSIGYDLAILHDVLLMPGHIRLADTGVRLLSNVPAFLYARSSLTARWNVLLANGVGVIDADYTDTIKVPLVQFTTNTIKIPTGTRVAQLVFHAVHTPIPTVRLVLGNMQNLHVGFGSTG